MKYKAMLDKVNAGEYNIERVTKLLENAKRKVQAGDMDAQLIVDACNEVIFAETPKGKRVAKANAVLDSDEVIWLQKYLKTGFTMLEDGITRSGHYEDVFGAKFANKMSWGAEDKSGTFYWQAWSSAFKEIGGKLFARVTYRITHDGHHRTSNTWNGQRNNQLDAWLSGQCDACCVPALGYRKDNGNMVTTHIANNAFNLKRNTVEIEGDVWAEVEC